MNLLTPFERPSRQRSLAAWQTLLAIALTTITIQLTGLVQVFASQCCLSTTNQCDGQTSDGDEPCQDCSPHCPQCRCTHAAFATLLVPPLPRVGDVVWQLASEGVFEPQAPRAPPLPALYHPPKFALRSS
jgi:hypothetical protein